MSKEQTKTPSNFVYKLLRIEGLIMLLSSIAIAFHFEYKWWFYIVIFFAPDISMFAFKKSNQLGALLYNITHTTSIPLVFLTIGIIFDLPLLISIMVIVIGHIGYDRMNGFGLKYKTDVNDTHLHRLNSENSIKKIEN